MCNNAKILKKKGKTFELNYYVHKHSMIKFFFYNDQLKQMTKINIPNVYTLF